MTVEEFISDYQDQKREMKQKEDELDFANKLMEKIREENKQLKGDITGVLDRDLSVQLENKKKIAEMIDAPEMFSKLTDTLDLMIHSDFDIHGGDNKIFEYGGDDPEQLKEKLADLSQKLQDVKNQNKVHSCNLESLKGERKVN